jgi:hypothetical protein
MKKNQERLFALNLLRWRTSGGRKVWTLQIRFEPRDLWMGLFWEYGDFTFIHTVCRRWFLCLIPMLPIVLTMQRTYSKEEWREHLEAAERVKEHIDPGTCTVREHTGLEKVVHKVNMGEKILPDPELGQDAAFLAFVIENMRGKS